MLKNLIFLLPSSGVALSPVLFICTSFPGPNFTNTIFFYQQLHAFIVPQFMALVSFGGLTISPVKLPISLIAKLKMIWKPKKKKKRIFHKEKMLVEKIM